MKEAQFVRRGKVIIDLSTGEAKDHLSINKAKRASREQQMSADGRLGAGTVRREAHKRKGGGLELTAAAIANIRARRA